MRSVNKINLQRQHSSRRNPQYLFSDSHKEACRRLRRVVEDGKA